MLRRLLSCAAIAVCAIGLAGCGGGGSPPEIDCGSTAVPSYSQVGAFQVCSACHSSRLTGDERSGAPDDVNYDTYEEAMAAAEEGADEVAAGAMPPEAFPLTDVTEVDLYAWVQCGTPP